MYQTLFSVSSEKRVKNLVDIISCGDVVDLHELLDAVQHVVVPGRRRVHLLEDCRHVTEDRRVQQRCK